MIFLLEQLEENKIESESESEVAQLCLTLSDPMDCSSPGSSVHGIFQARVLEWGAIDFSGIRQRPLLNPKGRDCNCNFFFSSFSVRSTIYQVIHPAKCLLDLTLPDKGGTTSIKHGLMDKPEIETRLCHSYSRKQRGMKEPLDESERGE